MAQRKKHTKLITEVLEQYREAYEIGEITNNLTLVRWALIHSNVLKSSVEMVPGDTVQVGVLQNGDMARNAIYVGTDATYSEETFQLVENMVTRAVVNLARAKLGATINKVSVLSPFYTAILNGLRKTYDSGRTATVETMGVTRTEFFINAEFVYGTPIPDLNFVVLHEIHHLADMHPVREGTREHGIWNAVCDLYINKFIAKEYGLEPRSDGTIPIQTKTHNQGVSVQLRLPHHSFKDIRNNPCLTRGLYDDYEYLPGYEVDIDKDTPESLYSLAIKNRQSMNKSGKGGQGGLSVGKQGNSQSNPSDGGGMSLGGNSKDTPNDNPKKRTQGNSKNESNFGDQLAKMSDQDILDALKKAQTDINKSNHHCTRNGNNAVPYSTRDIQNIKQLLQRALTTAQLQGAGHCALSRKVSELLRPKFDLRQLLRAYLKPAKSRKMSYARPNKKYLYRDIVLPAQGKMDKNSLCRVKICIDTSGSISHKDLAKFMGLIADILDEFKVTAEIICWDTECAVIGELTAKSTAPSIKKLQDAITGGGGTDPTCLFEYFDSAECKVKPYAIFILTDGYIGFHGNKQKYSQLYKNVLWVISHDGDKYFHPPFGLAQHWDNIDRLGGGTDNV